MGRVLSLDAPGHGQSEAPPAFTLADQAPPWRRSWTGSALGGPSSSGCRGAGTSGPGAADFLREERSIPASAVRRLREGLRGSKIVFIEGAGHLAVVDSPREVLDHPVPFVRSLLEEN